jgi:DNA primase
MDKEFSGNDIKTVKAWANKHVRAILQHLGIRHSDQGKYLKACCPVPYHPGDGNNPGAWVWSYDKQNWRCYTHSCQEDTGSDIIGLVMSMKEFAFPIAVKYLIELKNGELQKAQPEEVAVKMQAKADENRFIEKSKLNILFPDTYFRGRGIPERLLQKHRVGYWQKTGTFMDRRAVVPMYDWDNNLVGFSGRVILTDEELASTSQAKWMHGRDFVTRKAGVFNKSSILYNLNNCKGNIIKTGKVYIVEGPIDVWKLEKAGITNVVATLGISISFEQIQLLVRAGVTDVVLCYDNDSAGNDATVRVTEQIKDYFNVSARQPKDNKDYGEMTTHDILENLL